MTDFYLKFPDQQTAEELLFQDVEPVTFDESGIDVTQRELRFDMAIDVIGVIYRPAEETLLSPDGEYPEIAPLDGWHVNVRGEVTDEMAALLSPYVVTPAHPIRVWA